MRRALKTLGIGTVLLAIGLAAVPIANAEAGFNSELSETTITSTPDGAAKNSHQVFDFVGLSFTCGGVTLHSLQVGKTVTQLPISAQYTSCLFVGQATTLNMRGCAYVFHSNGKVDIVNKAGGNCATEPMRLTVTGLSCQIDIGPQSSLSEVKFSNVKPGASKEITVATSISAIKYTATGADCPLTGTFTNGALTTGNVLLTGAEVGGAGNMTDLSWE